MASIQNQILAELNSCRKNPKAYSSKLQSTLKYYEGKILRKPDSPEIETEEGTRNIIACIEYLKGLKPLPVFTYNNSLEKAATDHVNDIGATGSIGHEGSDGSLTDQRIEKYADWEGAIAENIDFGNKSAEDIVVSLLIDDGVSNRGHRLNILNPDHLTVGVGFGNHPEMEYACVIVFAQSIREKTAERAKKVATPRASVKQDFAEDAKKPLVRPKEKPKPFDPSEYLRPGFNEDDILEMKQAFDLLDTDKSGGIDPTELKSVIEEYGLDAKNSTMFQMVSDLDTDGSGTIDFNEFLDMISGRTADENSMEEVRKVFNIFDSDKIGHITLKNLKNLTKEIGEIMSDETLSNLIKKGDSNSDGLVSFEDFYYIMTRTVL